MSRIYSRRLYVGELSSSTPVLIYTVPTGIVTVLRDVTMFGAADVVAWIELIRPPSTDRYRVVGVTANPTVGGGFGYWSGRVVLNAGEELYAATDDDVNMTVTGYELTA